MFRRYLPVISSLFLVAAPLYANIGAILPMGDLDQWGAFTLGINGPIDHLLNTSEVDGDIGVSGNGHITLAGSTVLNGDVYTRQWGVARMGPNTTINGSQFNGENALLDADANLALNLSRAATLLTPTQNLSMIDLNGTNNLTLSGAPGQTVVLNLRMIRMQGNSTLTLQGSANTTYVINVNRGFSLTDAARIVLSGGLDWNDVLFNVRGTGATVNLSGHSSFQGILLASRRTVQVQDAAILRGEVIADNLQMQGTAQITHPAAVSP